MRGYFSVNNWDEYQHYKDRDPTWIKLYNRLLDNYEFGLLPDASKWHLIGIFLLASRYKNRIPADVNWVSARIGATSVVDLTMLANSGFVTVDHICSEPLAITYQSSIPENKVKLEQVEEELTSDKSDISKPEPQPVKKRTPYPEAFETFWREYPTDALMSKKNAFAQWQRLTPEDREAARSAIPAFKDYCRKNPTYRPVHAQRFISERRFDGFEAGPTLTAEQIAANKDRADKLFGRGQYAEKAA
jgi:hypothetical protein